ncbi:MAG: hypothetical protein AAGD01_04520 [Acidobacteriota bacterium]
MLASFASSPVGAETFVFERVNSTFDRSGMTFAPVTAGALTVNLSSPRNEVTILEHEVRLAPLGRGRHAVRVEVEVEGFGELLALLSVGDNESELSDEVLVPRQRVEVVGLVSLESRPAGFVVEIHELPDTVDVAIDSGLAGRLANTCRRLAGLMPLLLPCDRLESALAKATLPLPPSGHRFLIPNDLLTDADRQRLAAYLGEPTGATADPPSAQGSP